MHYISILSTIVTFAFAAAVLLRYSQRGGMHLLLWGVGLILYGLGTLSEVYMLFAYNPFMLKVWYLTGAMLTAAWLGQGTAHLLIRKRGVAMGLTIMLALISLLAISLVMVAPVTNAAFSIKEPVSSQYAAILTRSNSIITLTILLNIYGTLALVGGAVYSAFLFWRKHVLINRLLGNILIAAGAMMPAMGGSFIKAGLTDWLYVSEFLGAVIMFIGFTQATYKPAAEKEKIQPAPAGD